MDKKKQSDCFTVLDAKRRLQSSAWSQRSELSCSLSYCFVAIMKLIASQRWEHRITWISFWENFFFMKFCCRKHKSFLDSIVVTLRNKTHRILFVFCFSLVLFVIFNFVFFVYFFSTFYSTIVNYLIKRAEEIKIITIIEKKLVWCVLVFFFGCTIVFSSLIKQISLRRVMRKLWWQQA